MNACADESQFNNHVAPSLKEMDTPENHIENLHRTRDLLLPRLLSGQVNLKEN